MSEHKEWVDRLNRWDVPNILEHPAITLGMLRTAAHIIEQLTKEVDRLNWENLWLTRGDE